MRAKPPYGGARGQSRVRWILSRRLTPAPSYRPVSGTRTLGTAKAPGTPHLRAGHAVRIVPICEKLQPILMDLFEQADEGAVDMVPLAKLPVARMYQRFGRIVERAGLTRWPRLLQNLRSSCATDWTEVLPAHVVAKWIGHSPLLAAKHYLQTRDAHFEVASRGGSCSSGTAQPSE